MKPDLSMVIPCYMEAQRLPPTLAKWKGFIERMDFKIETIIVVEPCSDDTLKVAKEWQNKMKGVQVIENSIRLGKGGSVRRGFQEARGKILAFMDADGSTELSFFIQGYEKIKQNKAKVVIASRGLEDSQILTKQSYMRQIMGRVFRVMTRWLMGLPFIDTQCGAKMFHRDTIPFLFKPLQEFGFAFDVEILLRSKLAHIHVLEMACIWRDMEGTTVNPIRDGWRMLCTLVKLKLYFLKYRKQVKQFSESNLPTQEHRKQSLVV